MTSPVLIAPDPAAARLDGPAAPTLREVRTPAAHGTAHVPDPVDVPLRRGRRRWSRERQVRLAAETGTGPTAAAVTDGCAPGAALPALPCDRGDRPVERDDVVDVRRSAASGPTRAATDS